MSETSLQAVKIVKIYPTEFWYEKDMMGTMSLKAQHEGMHECTLVQIPYDYAYTSNAGQWALLQHLCKYFGLLKDIEQRPSKFDAELIRQATSVDAIDKTQERVEESAKNVHELADELDQAVFKLIASDNCTEAQAVEESQGVLRLLQDKLDIETAYNAIHIERIQALRSALTEILENDGSRRIYSAGGLCDAREKAEALLREAGNQDA